jgi:hypothetical protein
MPCRAAAATNVSARHGSGSSHQQWNAPGSACTVKPASRSATRRWRAAASARFAVTMTATVPSAVHWVAVASANPGAAQPPERIAPAVASAVAGGGTR